MKNKEPYLLLSEGKKRKLVRIIRWWKFFCLREFFWNKKYIFSYTIDLCGRVGDKKSFARSISWNKTTFFWPYFFTAAAFLFFRTVTFFRSSYFFRLASFSERKFNRAVTSWEWEVLYGSYVSEQLFFSLFRIKISKKELLLQSRYFYTV